MGTQTSRATYSRLLSQTLGRIQFLRFHSVNLGCSSAITFDGGGSKLVVLPPCGQRSADGKPGGDHLFELGALDGQQRL